MHRTNASAAPRPGPRVLVVDDDPAIHQLAAAFLKPMGAIITTATGGDEALAIMRQSVPDVVLLDFDMPGQNGLHVLQAIKDDPVLRTAEVIFSTGTSDQSLITRCFALGATDFTGKPFSQPELLARMRSAWERRTLLRELKQAARIDALTGLANRSLLTRRLSRALETVRSDPDQTFALLFLDFDRFKVINDSLGHDVGDDLLRAISARLRHNLRASDSISYDAPGTTLSRFGGDEFVILVDQIPDESAAVAVAERLLRALSDAYAIGPHTVSSTASIGVVFGNAAYACADDVLRDADTAMYEAKARGKACAVLFDPAMRQAVYERHDLELELRSAIGTDQMRLVYQPIIELESGIIQGMEALIRWDHPVRGAIPPSRFIPIAEESRLILPLSDWILKTACREFSELCRSRVIPELRYISINLSRIQLDDPDLVPKVLRTIAESGMRPDQCQLEITESEIMHDKKAAIHLLNEMKHAGIRLAMDDFGTGYSSLACLHELPFDVIKIDRSFVSHLTEIKQEFVALVSAICHLADNLGMPCVAEGLERNEQLAVLVGINCRYGQGYLFGRPMPLNAYLDGTWIHRKVA